MKLNLANFLTLLRIAAIPIVVVCFYSPMEYARPIAAVLFGLAAVMNPRFCAGMMGTLIRDMGHERVFWGTDSVWYGSPQWQIEALRRMEIPEDLQKSHGFAPMGEADGPVKSTCAKYSTASCMCCARAAHGG